MKRILFTLALLVAATMIVVAATQSDNFNRADAESLGANWLDIANTIDIVSNQADGDIVDYSIARWAGTALSADIDCSATLKGVVDADDLAGLYVRMSADVSPNEDGYMFRTDASAAQSRIFECTNGSCATLATSAVTFPVNTVVRFRAEGSNLTVYKDGVSAITATDASFTTGQPGIHFYADEPAWDDWSCTEIGGGGRRMMGFIGR